MSSRLEVDEKISKVIDFSVWDKCAITGTHICYCTVFPFLDHCDFVACDEKIEEKSLHEPPRCRDNLAKSELPRRP